MFRIAIIATCCTVISSPCGLHAVEDEVAAKARAEAGQPAPTKGLKMLYGPVLSCAVEAPAAKETTALPKYLASKGLVIQLGKKDEAYVCFDTDTLRMAAGWVKGFLNLQNTNIGTYKGTGTSAGEIVGEVKFRTTNRPGWSKDAIFSDPRAEQAGPLPKQLGHFKGFYLHENRVVLSYEIEGCAVMESPSLAGAGFVRSFTAAPSAAPLHLLIAESDGKAALPATAIIGEVSLEKSGNRLEVTVPAHKATVNFAVMIGPPAAIPAPEDLSKFCKGGPARWPQTITAAGTVSQAKDAYVVDTIPLPEVNPWNSWMRLSALDFFSDGRAAVTTLNGDVWIVSGLDSSLQKVTWKRFAVGLYEPMGLRIVKDTIYVHGRDRITRLHDFNGDGEADFYESFNSDRTLFPSYHAFAFDLQTDSKGNFYYIVGGNQLGTKRDWHAALFRVSPDGSTTETVATGFRAPNGMGIGPHDEIVVGDNQGHWIPSSKVSLIKPGGFYGHVADPRVSPKAVAPAAFEPPVCYIPMAMDNSTGGQVWVTGGKWGPFEGRMLSTSYGKSALLAILDETVDGVAQGGAITLPVKFSSGIMRARFSPKDGQLYTTGLKGWQTSGVKDGCFQRVRYTGRPVHLPTALHVGKEQISISFPEVLATAEANDAANFSVEEYDYKWWSTYGSPELKISQPGEKGRDKLEVKSASLSADGRTVTLAIPELKPAMQMEIKLHLRAADGGEIQTTIGNTINKLR